MLKLPKIEELMEAGVHFGHQARRWNPKMASFIFSQNAGVHVIDLEKTEKQLKVAAEFMKEIGQRGGTVIFLATKKQAAEIIAQEASRVGAMYLTQRWFGGLFTNFESVHKTVEKLGKLEETLNGPEAASHTKKEKLLMQREINKLNHFVGGIRGLTKLPDCLFIIDARREDNAVREAKKTGVPVIALVDTNADPTKVDYPIAANDDAIKSISILVKTIADAYSEGRKVWEKKSQEKKEVKEEERVES
jgi:small subunit ribosomal protein S2